MSHTACERSSRSPSPAQMSLPRSIARPAEPSPTAAGRTTCTGGHLPRPPCTLPQTGPASHWRPRASLRFADTQRASSA
eukprot:6505790-Pyramimonas_sp.AAC.2